jgi:hypothetical protein
MFNLPTSPHKTKRPKFIPIFILLLFFAEFILPTINIDYYYYFYYYYYFVYSFISLFDAYIVQDVAKGSQEMMRKALEAVR